MAAYGSYGQVGTWGDITTRGCCTSAPEGAWIPPRSFGPIRGAYGAWAGTNWDKKCAEAQVKVAELEAKERRDPIAWVLKGNLAKDLAKWRKRRDEYCRLAAEAKTQRDAETAALMGQGTQLETAAAAVTAPPSVYSAGNTQAAYVPQPAPKTASSTTLAIGGVVAVLGIGVAIWYARR